MRTLGRNLTLKKTTIQLLDDASLVDVRGGIQAKIIFGSNTCSGGVKENARSCCEESCTYKCNNG